jgi:hypothetical protein
VLSRLVYDEDGLLVGTLRRDVVVQVPKRGRLPAALAALITTVSGDHEQVDQWRVISNNNTREGRTKNGAQFSNRERPARTTGPIAIRIEHARDSANASEHQCQYHLRRVLTNGAYVATNNGFANAGR